jgi:CRP/FNR family transcriptional regulator, cyclic AMP receptor protein
MPAIALQDVMGFAAAATTLVAFLQRASVPMRLAAATSNLFFIAYGALGALYPPLVLHCIRLPLNLTQLAREMRTRSRAQEAEPRPHRIALELRCPIRRRS